MKTNIHTHVNLRCLTEVVAALATADDYDYLQTDPHSSTQSYTNTTVTYARPHAHRGSALAYRVVPGYAEEQGALAGNLGSIVWEQGGYRLVRSQRSRVIRMSLVNHR